MSDRRNFLTKGVMAVSAAALGSSCNSVNAEEKNDNPSGVGGYSYRLPSFKKGTRLLFQGDSITDMKWGRNQEDRNHYLGHSYVYLIASRLGVDMAAAKLVFFNRGISGNKVADLKKRWQKDALDIKPDILSILVGVNDVRSFNVTNWEVDYRSILDASRKANPDLKIVLLDPFVLKSGRLKKEDEWKKYRGTIETQIPIVTQLAKDYQAVHVKTQEVFGYGTEFIRYQKVTS
jgi:lysophospholipase L1-like esterase